jgi:TetR/AcrR family transcriptional regulator, transcriptional repressor for nem operon
MRATGLEKGGIYRHFRSKQQLAAEAFDYSCQLAMETRFQGTQAIPNTVDRLKQIVRNFRDKRAGLVPGGCPLLNMATDSDDSSPELRTKTLRAFDVWFEHFRKIAAEGRRRGEVRSTVDPAQLATLLVSSLEGGLMLFQLQRTEKPLDIACRHLEDYLETSVRAKRRKFQVGKT